MTEPLTLDPESRRPPPFPEGEATLASLEERVHRLEETVSSLQDTRDLEERILERLRDKPQAKVSDPPADEHIMEKPAWESSPPPRQSSGPFPEESAVPLSGLAEFRAMARMFFDMHYHVAWSTRLLVLVLIPLIITSYWWFPPAWLPFVGFVFDKIFDVVLAFLLYKVLAAEARRYHRNQATGRPHP